MSNPFANKSGEEIANCWQARALREADFKLRRVLICMFMHDYKDAIKILLRATFPGFVDISRPLILGYAKIMPSGHVVAKVLDYDGREAAVPLYDSEGLFLYEARKVADKLKLADADRKAMFDVLQRWIAADARYGRHGERLAS